MSYSWFDNCYCLLHIYVQWQRRIDRHHLLFDWLREWRPSRSPSYHVFGHPLCCLQCRSYESCACPPGFQSIQYPSLHCLKDLHLLMSFCWYLFLCRTFCYHRTCLFSSRTKTAICFTSPFPLDLFLLSLSISWWYTADLDDFVQTTPCYLCNHESELHHWRHVYVCEFSYQVVGSITTTYFQIGILFIHNSAFSVCQFLKFHVDKALSINASHHFDIEYSQNLCH